MDRYVALLRLRNRAGACALKLLPIDFQIDYKAISIHYAPGDVASVCFSFPEAGGPLNSRILAQPFGSRHAPANWTRVVAFLQFLAIELLFLAVVAFLDDVICAERNAVFQSGFWAFKRLCAILGFATSCKNDQPPCAIMVLLGDDIQLPGHGIRASPMADRVGEICCNVAHALTARLLGSR